MSLYQKRLEREKKRLTKWSPRVTAWVHTVINPLLEALEVEQHLLKEHNWTWRYSTETLEFIKPIKRYLGPPEWPNYEDYLRANPESRGEIEKHDTLIEQLDAQCEKAFRELIASEEFLSKVSAFLSEYAQNFKDQPYPGGAISEQDFPKLVAQRIINNQHTELPEYYTDALFWKSYRENFLLFRKRNVFDILSGYGEELKRTDERLVKYFEDIRFKFCEEYDIPASPLA
ncbi:MAG: hypothetical protein AB1393_03020 [Candidatus Edwardsbacteria bacterium]